MWQKMNKNLVAKLSPEREKEKERERERHNF